MKYTYTTEKDKKNEVWYLIQNEKVIGTKNLYMFNDIIYVADTFEEIIEKLKELNKRESGEI